MASRRIAGFLVGIVLFGSATAVSFASQGKGLGVCEGSATKMLFGPRVSTINDAMSSWIGSGLDEVVASWGAPYSTFENRDGSRIVTWKEWDCTKNFKVDAQDVLTQWNVGSGCRCFSDRSPRDVPRSTPIPEMTL